jgi:four helix bundle protein
MYKRGGMEFDHERLDVYQASIKFSSWLFSLINELKGPHRHARDQLMRASQSIPANIAEGNGKRSLADRKRFWEIARGSALECAVFTDIFVLNGAITKEKSREGKTLLHRNVSMLTKMTERSRDGVRESYADYEHEHDKEKTINYFFFEGAGVW